MTDLPAIELEAAGVTYANGTRALHDVDLRIMPGEFVILVGTSGAGKSTLLRTLNGLTPLTRGSARIQGQPVPQRPGADLRRLRAGVGMIFQDFRLSRRLTVMTNVLMGRLARVPGWRSLLGLWPERDREIAMTALARVNLTDKAWVRAGELSGGQQQRVGIARALAQEPGIILADEPVASLDPVTTRQIMADLVRINRELGITTVVNLHDLDLARRYGQRIIGLRHGELVFDGATDAVSDADFTAIYGDSATGTHRAQAEAGA